MLPCGGTCTFTEFITPSSACCERPPTATEPGTPMSLSDAFAHWHHSVKRWPRSLSLNFHHSYRPLLIPQSHDRIDSRRAPGRSVGSNSDYNGEHQAGACQCDRIVRCDSKQKGAQGVSCDQRQGNSCE